MNVERKARILFACGAPGSGKSHFLKEQLAQLRADRLIVVDPDGEYDGYGYLHDRPEDAYRATLFASFRTRLQTSHTRAKAEQQFDAMCRLVRWHAAPDPGQAAPPRVAPVVFLVDELADFVGPSFRESPESWQWVIRKGRKHGVTLLAASQRPAQIDKSLFDLASSIRTGRLNNGASQRAIADALGVQAGEIAQLTGYQWLMRDKNTGKLARGGK